MPYTIEPQAKKPKRKKPATFKKLTKPLKDLSQNISPLEARGDRPLQMTFEDQLHALIYFHLEEHTSGRYLLQALEEDDFARDVIARSWYGLMVQILAGLITYLLLAIYCHEEYHEKISIKRVRQLRIKIRNEARSLENLELQPQTLNYDQYSISAKT